LTEKTAYEGGGGGGGTTKKPAASKKVAKAEVSVPLPLYAVSVLMRE